jgi:hypothetical protein
MSLERKEMLMVLNEIVGCFEATNEIVRLRVTTDRRPICPVCGDAWAQPDAEHAWHPYGPVNPDGVPCLSPSFSICPSCHTEFGNDDIPDAGMGMLTSWAILRYRWLDSIGWNAKALAQLQENLAICEKEVRNETRMLRQRYDSA